MLFKSNNHPSSATNRTGHRFGFDKARHSDTVHSIATTGGLRMKYSSAYRAAILAASLFNLSLGHADNLSNTNNLLADLRALVIRNETLCARLKLEFTTTLASSQTTTANDGYRGLGRLFSLPWHLGPGSTQREVLFAGR
jgi:hypothetical protein